LPLATTVDTPELVCADCRGGEPRFDFARSYGVYAGRLRTAVLEVKFHGRERLGKRLGGLLSEPWRALMAAARVTGPVLIIPVPLHRSRERERGYNQARLLAEGLRHALKIGDGTHEVKLDARRLVRNRATSPQSGLSLHARGENVRGVFNVAAAERVRDRDVVLVDDVMTTGATASACAGALKRAGARRVIVLTLARATPQFPDVGPVDQHARART
jgi:ComF family protein